MPETAAFDALIAAFRGDVARAQARLAKSDRLRSQRAIDIDGEGRPTAARRLEMPMISLRPFIQTKIVEVSLELLASIEEAPANPAEADPSPALALLVHRLDDARAPTLRRVRITLRGDQPAGGGDVTIDGRSFKTIPPVEQG